MYLYIKNNKGFTLLEGLMGMFVMSVLVMLILQMVLVLNDTMISYYNKRQDTLFIMQANRDFFKSQNTYVKDNILYFETYDKETITYEKSEDKIIRQVNNAGYEVILSNIESAKFYEENNKFYLEVKHNNEQEKILYIGTNYF